MVLVLNFIDGVYWKTADKKLELQNDLAIGKFYRTP